MASYGSRHRGNDDRTINWEETIMNMLDTGRPVLACRSSMRSVS
jgi:hypothetical protein